MKSIKKFWGKGGKNFFDTIQKTLTNEKLTEDQKQKLRDVKADCKDTTKIIEGVTKALTVLDLNDRNKQPVQEDQEYKDSQVIPVKENTVTILKTKNIKSTQELGDANKIYTNSFQFSNSNESSAPSVKQDLKQEEKILYTEQTIDNIKSNSLQYTNSGENTTFGGQQDLKEKISILAGKIMFGEMSQESIQQIHLSKGEYKIFESIMNEYIDSILSSASEADSNLVNNIYNQIEIIGYNVNDSDINY